MNASVGPKMRPAAGQWQAPVRRAAEALMQDRAIPGMVIAVANAGERPEYLAVRTDVAGISLAPDTRFPVASITKLATVHPTRRIDL